MTFLSSGARLAASGTVPTEECAKLLEKYVLLVFAPARISGDVSSFKPLVATLMLALFAFASSHPLLESLGLIHEEVEHADGPAHSENNHEAADGICRIESNHEELQKPLADSLNLSPSLVLMFVLVLNANPDADPGGGSLSPPPPELGTSWQFSSRAALPARAPSSAS